VTLYLPNSLFPRPSPQNYPEVLSYPILTGKDQGKRLRIVVSLDILAGLLHPDLFGEFLPQGGELYWRVAIYKDLRLSGGCLGTTNSAMLCTRLGRRCRVPGQGRLQRC
jgi:hypothetical protein